MSIVKYEIFRKVVEVGSLTSAAESLGLTQSAVSHAIASLEDEFGFLLLVRNRMGVRLTVNGERILKHVHEILSGNEHLKQEVAAINGLEVGTIRIGTFSSVAIHWLPGMMKQFLNDHPSIDIKLVQGNYHEIEVWIKNGEIDFGFLSLPSTESFETIPLEKDRMLCIVSREHPLSQQSCIRYDQIEKEMFIMPTYGCDQDVRRILQLHSCKPHVQFQAGNDHAIIAMVENGLGISIISEMIIKGWTHNVMPIELEDGLYRMLGIAIPSLRNASPATRKFIDHAQSWLKGKGIF
ncbi:LysR family transcriptional regulator [Paenibacillus sp. MY03]|uniref:LysR family transcriptional regulator n=1 Tax=Paenibacillus sp. MY03 TaxID=302980 RepID=UPI000B3C9FC2|nr:LysR family transcriptional regulator [Paenibacillus sp. MY03]OUS76995.1 LysR family transcriptional regulator [Paenibacillus sp. MY03]